MQSTGIPLLIASDSRLFADSLIATLGASSAFQILGSVLVEDAPRTSFRLAAQLVLVDATASHEDALAAVSEVKKTCAKAKSVVLGMAVLDEEMVRFIEAGSASYLPFSTTPEMLVDNLQSVHGGELQPSVQLLKLVIKRLREISGPQRTSPVIPLTDRQREIIQLISQGRGNKEIAQDLGISTSTAKNHVHKLLRNLNAKHRRDAIIRACEASLLTEDCYNLI